MGLLVLRSLFLKVLYLILISEMRLIGPQLWLLVWRILPRLKHRIHQILWRLELIGVCINLQAGCWIGASSWFASDLLNNLILYTILINLIAKPWISCGFARCGENSIINMHFLDLLLCVKLLGHLVCLTIWLLVDWLLRVIGVH